MKHEIEELLAERDLDMFLHEVKNKQIEELNAKLEFCRNMFSIHGIDPDIIKNYRGNPEKKY